MNLIPFYNDVISWNAFVGNDISNKELSVLYTDLVFEETQEIFDSIKDKDPVEFIDGVCDSLVVGSYLLAIKNSDNFDLHVHNLKDTNILSGISSLEKLVKKDIIFNEIENIIKTLESLSYSSKLDIVKACEEVMRSNWSKFPLTSDVNPDNEVEYIESQGRYSGVVYEINKDSNGNTRYIFKSDAGKVVKPSTFSEPKLADFVNQEFLNLSNIF